MSTLEQRATAATHEVDQPGHPARGLQHVRVRPGAGRGAAPRGRRLGRAAGQRGRRLRRLGAGDPLGLRGEREPAEAAHPRPLRQPRSTRSSSTPPGTSCSAPGSASALHALPWREPQPGSPRRARGDVRRLAGRGGGRLPDLDDLLGDPGAAKAARARRRVGAALHLAALRRRAPAARRRQGRRALRDGDDREAGRLRRARQHHGRGPAERWRAGRRVRAHAATSGSCRRRCATRSSSSPRPRAGSPAS